MALIDKDVIANDTSCIVALAYSRDGSLLATGTNRGSVALFDVSLDSGKLSLRSQLQGHSLDIHSLVFSPDGRALGTASGDGTVRIWDVTTGQERVTLPIKARLIAFSPDGSMLALVHDKRQRMRLLTASADPWATALKHGANEPTPTAPRN